MHSLITNCLAEIAELCRRHHVQQLDVFGSAASGAFDTATSDIDFLVEFERLEPVAYKRAFFGLLWDLEALFGRPVDLVTAPSMRNPYFIKTVFATRERVYGG